MAILPSLPGLEVTVLVNGNALQEYDDADFDESNQNTREMSKYVASVAGAEFSISLKFTKKILNQIHPPIELSLSLDGDYVDVSLWELSELLEGALLENTATEENGQWYGQKYKFCDLQINEEGSTERWDETVE